MMFKKLIPKSIKLNIKQFLTRKSLTVSEAGQDYWIYAEAFNEKMNGYFLDIGAHDGLYASNTYLLESRYNWTGICIEANPDTFSKLVKNRNVRCLNICLDHSEGEVQFLKKGATGGIVDKGLDNSAYDEKDENIVTLNTKPLVQVLNEQNAPEVIDYLSIDVEGAEERILGDFDFGNYMFRCISIERPSANLKDLLQQNRYVLVREIPGLDCFYVHEKFIDQYMKNLIAFYKKKYLKICWS